MASDSYTAKELADLIERGERVLIGAVERREVRPFTDGPPTAEEAMIVAALRSSEAFHALLGACLTVATVYHGGDDEVPPMVLRCREAVRKASPFATSHPTTKE